MKQADTQVPRTEIGLVRYAGCQLAMIYGMTDLLQTAGQLSAKRGGPPLRVSHWSPDASGRFERVYDSHPGGARHADFLIAPGRLTGPVSQEESANYAVWLSARHAEGCVLASSCGGSFLLGETGLLDGRQATTHWAFAEPFSMRFPAVKLDVARIVIDEGDIITAGGLMAWTDLGLRLIERVFGAAIAGDTARYFLIDAAGRQQAHFAGFMPKLMHGDETILKVQHWLQAKGGNAVSVADMARHACLEERTFLRRFKTATGLKPTEYAQHLRIEKARELLQYTRRPVEQVAWSVGYEDPTAFRRVFHRFIGLSPGHYRRRFAPGTADEGARLNS